MIPAELRPALDGRREFIFSLKTKDREEAKRAIPRHAIATDAVLEEARKPSPQQTPETGRQTAGVDASPMADAAFLHSLEAAEMDAAEDAGQQARQEAREEESAYWKRRMAFTTRELSPKRPP